MADSKNIKVETIKEFGRKASTQARYALSQAVIIIEDNKELILASIPVVVALLKTGQSVSVNKRLRKERERIDNTYYDPSTGFHWELRRKATNKDRAEILRRKNNGQDTYTILKQMGLIK